VTSITGPPIKALLTSDGRLVLNLDPVWCQI